MSVRPAAPRLAWHVVALAVVLTAIAAAVPDPTWSTDRGTYERMSREWIIPGCGDVQCFRPLVSWVLGWIPGPSGVVWKGYAVVCQIGAAWAMTRLVRRLGLARRVEPQILWLTAMGSGALYTVFDPYTSDPAMHVAGPLLTVLLADGRVALAGALAVAGVIAKEFAAMPVWIAALTRAQEGRWPDARRTAVAALAATAAWAAWQVAARMGLGYTNGLTHSTEVLEGGYITFWLLVLSPSLIAASLAMVFGAVWLLWPAGLLMGPRSLRQITLAAGPAILVLCAVQQPDRALWNFAFLALPAAGVVLARVPAAIGWGIVATQSVANLRVGAQLTFVPGARFGFVVAAVLAVAAIGWAAVRPAAAGLTTEVTA